MPIGETFGALMAAQSSPAKPMPGKRLLIHGGMPKTGTSILQNSLAKLAHDRVAYAQSFRGAGIAHHSLGSSLINQNSNIQLISDILLSEVRSVSTESSLVVSTESLTSLINRGQIGKLRSLIYNTNLECETTFVLFVRELTGFMEAMYLQSTRFGHLSLSFEDYLRSRRNWIKGFLEGLKCAETDLGSSVELVYMRGSFDSVAFFESFLGLDGGELKSVASKQRPTSRYGILGESLLANLERAGEEIGVKLNRTRIISLLEQRLLFPNDIHAYTLYSNFLRSTMAEFCLTVARDFGLESYCRLFHPFISEAKEQVELSYGLLSRSDKSHLKDVYLSR